MIVSRPPPPYPRYFLFFSSPPGNRWHHRGHRERTQPHAHREPRWGPDRHVGLRPKGGRRARHHHSASAGESLLASTTIASTYLRTYRDVSGRRTPTPIPVPQPSKSLWIASGGRRMKSNLQQTLLACRCDNPDTTVVAVMPGGAVASRTARSISNPSAIVERCFFFYGAFIVVSRRPASKFHGFSHSPGFSFLPRARLLFFFFVCECRRVALVLRVFVVAFTQLQTLRECRC